MTVFVMSHMFIQDVRISFLVSSLSMVKFDFYPKNCIKQFWGYILCKIPPVQEEVTHFFTASYYIKWVTTSWTYSNSLNLLLQNVILNFSCWLSQIPCLNLQNLHVVAKWPSFGQSIFDTLPIALLVCEARPLFLLRLSAYGEGVPWALQTTVWPNKVCKIWIESKRSMAGRFPIVQ